MNIHTAFICLGLMGLTSSFAAEAPSAPGYRMTRPPTIDGIVNESDEWKGVPFIDGLVDTISGKASAETGRFWLAYDLDFIYFAARVTDTAPNQIRAHEFRTNVDFAGDDFVELDLDITGSLAGFNQFFLNPNGATRTVLAGGRAAKREWSGEFVSKGRVTANGWEVEARIPWQIMQLSKAGKRNLRVNFGRYLARLGQSFANAFTGNGQFDNVPRWLGVDVPRQALDRRIKVLPYGYAGYDPTQHGIFAAGADFKSALADQVQLVGTVHPDFRNVENGILSLDFSRFERLANETRPFFQEGSQYLNSALFASQRIKTFDAGVSSYGRLSDSTSFSVLNANQFGVQNSAVANVTHDPDPNTSWRGTVTDMETSSISNSAYLLRLSKQIGPTNIFLRDMGTKDSEFGFGRNDTAQTFIQKNEWQAFASYTEVMPNFKPRLGFSPEVDFKGVDYQIGYAAKASHGPFLDYTSSFSGTSYNRYDNSPYRREQTVVGGMTMRNGIGFDAIADFAGFEGSKDELFGLTTTFPRYNRLNQTNLSFNWGHQGGSAYQNLSVGGAQRLWKKLQLTLSHQRVNYGQIREQTVLGMNYEVNSSQSIGGRLFRQPNGQTNAYVSFSQKGNLGTEYYLIVGDPNAPTYRNSVILKMVVPFSIGKDPAKIAKKS